MARAGPAPLRGHGGGGGACPRSHAGPTPTTRGWPRLIDGVGLVYLSGGDPHHLAATLRGSLVLGGHRDGVAGGAALAGCSAGAMALTAGAPPDLGPGGSHRPAPAEPGGRREPGWDWSGSWPSSPISTCWNGVRPGIVEWFRRGSRRAPPWWGWRRRRPWWATGAGWQVHGGGAVWVFGAGEPGAFVAGDDVPLWPRRVTGASRGAVAGMSVRAPCCGVGGADR